MGLSDDLTPRAFADSLFGPEDERRETCIHCGNEWYSTHYKDGVCHDCQQLGKPGRTALEKRRSNRKAMIAILLFALLLALMDLLIFR